MPGTTLGETKAPAQILIVDDEPFVREIVSRWITRDGHSCDVASDGEQALAALERGEFSLVVSDIMMPGMSGIELLKRIRATQKQTAVVMLTGVDDRKVASAALKLGAYGYVLKPLEENEILISVANALRRRELELLRDRYEEELEEAVRHRTRQLEATRNVTIYGMATLAEFRDSETGQHLFRVQHYVRALAEQLVSHRRFRSVLTPETVSLFFKSTPLHDIGKVGVPDAILLKPGPLSAAEFEEMKKHTAYGHDAIRRAEALLEADSDSSFLRIARELTISHHEKWDGSGYPYGLAGDAIPLVGRLMGLADVYDALISRRVYKPALTHARACEIILQGDGRVMPEHFDPDVLTAFRQIHEAFQQIAIRYADSPDAGNLLE